MKLKGVKKKGYSLKSPNRDGKYFIYVWDKGTYDREKTAEMRKKKGKNYSHIGGWISLGRADNPDTWLELENHLLNQYGTFEEQEVKQAILDEIEVKEKERLKKEKEEYKLVMDQILEILNRRNIRLKEIPSSKKEAEKLLKQMIENKIV